MRTPAYLSAMAVILCAAIVPTTASAQATPIRETESVPPAPALTAATTSELHDAVTRFGIDRAALLRRHDAPWSDTRRERLRSFYEGWTQRLAGLPFDSWGLAPSIMR